MSSIDNASSEPPSRQVAVPCVNARAVWRGPYLRTSASSSKSSTPSAASASAFQPSRTSSDGTTSCQLFWPASMNSIGNVHSVPAGPTSNVARPASPVSGAASARKVDRLSKRRNCATRALRLRRSSSASGKAR